MKEFTLIVVMLIVIQIGVCVAIKEVREIKQLLIEQSDTTHLTPTNE